MDILNKHGNNNHLVIITTRDVRVLVSAGIDTAYHLRGFNKEDGRELFCWQAFDQPQPDEGYGNLVEAFVNVCGGLPLSLIVLGRHVSRRPQWYWQDELGKVKETLPGDIKQRLKISIDTLDYVEKQIFMDIACFFIGKSITKAMLIWKGSGWRARHALETLKERCLVEEVREEHLNRLEYNWESTAEGYALRMHDHLRDFGREMADELSYLGRVWRPQHLKSLELKGFQSILTQSKSRIFHSIVDKSIGCAITYFLGKPKNGSDSSLLWLQLEYLSCLPLDSNLDTKSSIPSWVPLQNLQCLRISNGCFQKLWQSDFQAPSHLEELQIRETSVKEFPDLLGKLNNMKKIVLHAKYIQTDIWSLVESLKMNLSSFRMVGSGLEGHLAYNDTAEETALKSLVIYDFKLLWQGRVALNDEGWCRTVMNGLENLEISEYQELEELRLTHLSCLKKISIENCNYLRSVSGISSLAKLVELKLSDCGMLEFECLGLSALECLERLTIDGYLKMEHFELDGCEKLREIIFDCKNVVKLSIRDCAQVEKLADLTGPSCLKRIIIDGCGNLKHLRLHGLENLDSVSGKLELRQMNIIKCPMLEELQCLDKMGCLEQIKIDSCEKIQHIILPTSLIKLDVQSCRVLQRVAAAGDLTELTQLIIKQCPAVEELPSFAGVTDLAEIEIDFIEELQKITLPTGCVSLNITGCGYLQRKEGILIRRGHIKLYTTVCPKLDFRRLCSLSCLEEIEIWSCEKLQNIRLPTTLSKLDVNGCTVLQGIEGTSDLKRLVIRQCPALEELPSPSELNCLEEIKIWSCEKLQNIMLPTTLSKLDVYGCTVLQGIAGIAALIKLTRLCIAECPALELPCLGRLICIEKIEIDSCKNLQNNISAAEELHVPEYTRLSNCGYAVTRYFIDRWKSLPRRTCLIGKAVDGAKSSLNLSLFSEANIAVDGVTEITDAAEFYPDSDDFYSGMSAVIVCLAVAIDSSTSAEDSDDLKMCQGESLVTVVEYIEYNEGETRQWEFLGECEFPSIVQGFRVDLKESEKWKSMRLLRTIVDRLYDKE